MVKEIEIGSDGLAGVVNTGNDDSSDSRRGSSSGEAVTTSTDYTNITPPKNMALPIHPSFYATPVKRINQQLDMANFQSSIAYFRIEQLITSISQAVIQKQPSDISSNTIHPVFREIISILNTLSQWCDEIEPAKGPRRFGNISFRAWHGVLEERSAELISNTLLGPIESAISAKFASDSDSTPTTSSPGSQSPTSPLIELIPYFQGSFGSKQRLDYGTGHELSFLAFIGGLILIGVIKNPSGEDLLLVFETYFQIIRKLVLRYTLEPAGSHGVWGLDDHFHIPYILGSAQLVNRESGSSAPNVTTPSPRSVLDKAAVARYAKTNLYFNAVDFIYQVKRGQFFEHSPILYDITGVPTWNKIYRGMIKMYNAEVLGKFPVVQHFTFGEGLFPWRDFNGEELTSSQPREDEGVYNTSSVAAAAAAAGSSYSTSSVMPGVGHRSHNLMPGGVRNTARAHVSTVTGSTSTTIPPATVAPWARK